MKVSSEGKNGSSNQMGEMSRKHWFYRYPVKAGQFSLKKAWVFQQNCDFEGGEERRRINGLGETPPTSA